MVDAPKQTQRVAVLKTPLGKDVLNAVRLDGSEGLSELFEFAIEAVGERTPVEFDAAIGQNCTLTLEGKTVQRHYCGVLVEAHHLEASASLNTYRLVLRPWLWLLSRGSDCRIYHDKSTPDIIRDVFGRLGFSDFDMRLTESYSPREYCVQYRETHLDFLCRLMEEDGIYYFFEHADGKHTLVLADAKSSHRAIDGLPSLLYLERIVSGRSDQESIYEIATRRSFHSGKVALNDYDYEKPSASMEGKHANPAKYPHGEIELYDHHGRYKERSDGDRFAKVRLEAAQALDKRRVAVGDAPALVPGGLTRLTRHPVASENIEYLVVRCQHSFAMQEYRSGGDPGGEAYQGSYEFQPSERPFRAPMVTPRPRIVGPQTAKVVGEDAEIDVDEMGRILVHFHWEREGEASRRVRIAQPWAGSNWGSIVIPRIGQEVVVEFIEGDPDRPIVTGSVYNAEKKVPYTLPAEKTKAGVKSNSSTGGGGYNEIVLEDKKNAEEIGVHAQKDLNVEVRNSEARKIGEAFPSPSGQPSRKTELVKGDDVLDVKSGNQKVDIALDQEISAGKEITIEAGMKLTLKVGGSSIEITPAGITIKGTAKVDVNGGAKLSANAGIISLN